MNNRSLDGQEVQGGRQPVQERTQCEIPKNFSEKWKTSQVYKLVIYRWNEYTSILKLCKALGLWPGRRTLAAALTLTFICTLTAHGKFKPSVLKHFPTVFFSSLSPGHNPECGPDKVTFVHRASDSLCLRLPACLPAWAIDEVCEARMPFSAICVGNTICSKAENFMPIQSQTKCLSPTWLWLCLCLCVCVNFLIES